MKPRGLILILVALAAVFLAGLYAWRTSQEHGSEHVATPAAAIGGPFKLIDQDGRAVDESVLRGKWSAVFFGFTHCPDVCPGTLQALDVAAGQLGSRAQDFQIVFVGVDSQRDTPEAMKAYLQAQNLGVPAVGLTGAPGQIAATAKVYRAYYAVEGTGEETNVTHSNVVYLMDPEGGFKAALHHDIPPAQLAEEIRQAMG